MNSLFKEDELDEERISSRSIAEITGKRHDYVLRDIRRVFNTLDDVSLVYSKYLDANNQKRPECLLTKKEAVTLVVKYNPDALIKVLSDKTANSILNDIAKIDIKNKERRLAKTYLMTDTNTGFTKIGKSVKPKFREQTLQSKKPTISLLAVCDDLVENKLHRMYASKRVRGEWFNLTKEDIDIIINKFRFQRS